jgi:hydrogenase nickel incorporation protein HypB
MCIQCGVSYGYGDVLTEVGEPAYRCSSGLERMSSHRAAAAALSISASQIRSRRGGPPTLSATPAHGHRDRNLLAQSEAVAAQTRQYLRRRQMRAFNFLSSPGAGKTTLLTRTLMDLRTEWPFAVIGGDQDTTRDRDRLQATGCDAIQVNTGTGCHLSAAMVHQGLVRLNPPHHAMVMVENVGNLVCPALFDIGETAKVTILSVTEGDDKPLKYPQVFRASQVLILNKIDLLPYVRFDVARCLAYACHLNPRLQIFQVSALTGAGLTGWYDWLRDRAAA